MYRHLFLLIALSFSWMFDATSAVGQQPACQGACRTGLALIEQQMFDATNTVRARYGLAPLGLEANLQANARSHCAWMARTRCLAHSPGRRENIAMGQRSAAEALRTWMRSPGHRANILGRSRWLGVSACSLSGSTTYYCQQFR
jgi:uncharacterized protein YkwD